MLSFIVLLAAVHAKIPFFLAAEEDKAKEKGKKEMKASVYEKLQDWQLMAIVKAAPDYIEKVEGKLKKVMDKCKRRRFPGAGVVPLPIALPNAPLIPINDVGPAHPGGGTSYVAAYGAEGKDNEEKMDGGKKDKKKKKKVDKMKPEELVKKAIAIDDKLKKMEKKIKKYSKNC